MTVREAILTLNTNVVIACERSGFSSATVKMIEDALDTIEDALKAQEPRVLTLGEVMALEEGTGDVWIEDAPMPGRVPCISATTMMDKSTLDSDGEVEFFDCSIYAITDYNANRANGWRCWTARPTEAQREAATWKS